MANLADRIKSHNLLVLRRAARTAVGKGRRLRRPPRILFPTGVERTYTKQLRNIVAAAGQIVDSRLVPKLPSLLGQAQAPRPTADGVRADAYGDAIANLLELVRSEFLGTWDEETIAAMVRKVGAAVAAQNGGEITKVFSDVLGVDLFAAEPWLAAESQAFVQGNVALIKTVSADYFGRVEALVYDGVRQGTPWRQLAASLRTGPLAVSQRRAELIARDQVSKYNGQLSKLRQTQAGVDEYIWRTSRDARVRHDHAELDGTTQSWDSPPVVDKASGRHGHPGDDYQCRCYAEPVLDEFTEAAG